MRDAIVSAVLLNTHCDVLTAQKCASDVMGFMQRRPDIQTHVCAHEFGPSTTTGSTCKKCGYVMMKY